MSPEIINGTSLSNLCDYSFGDHMGAASIPRPKGGFMQMANSENKEFLAKAEHYRGKTMTLFIDNIRLYNRPLWANQGSDAEWVTYLLQNNDLLNLCSSLPENKFIIFTSHEDTPIDSSIKIPENVIKIYAVNAEFFGDKISPFPYGLQRELGEDDHRISIMKDLVHKDEHIEPTKLLYINCGIERNPERTSLVQFQDLPWTTARFDKDSKYFPYSKYRDFLREIQDHKFMVCPKGHGLDCHRNWESLYLRRVPVMIRHPYFEQLMKPWPVLFVSAWSDITPELLRENEHLYHQAQTMDLMTLDLNRMFDHCIMDIYESRG